MRWLASAVVAAAGSTVVISSDCSRWLAFAAVADSPEQHVDAVDSAAHGPCTGLLDFWAYIR